MEIVNNPQRYCENCTCQNCIVQHSVEIEGFGDYRIFRDGKVFSKKSNKYFKTLTEALVYKFIQVMKRLPHK